MVKRAGGTEDLKNEKRKKGGRRHNIKKIGSRNVSRTKMGSKKWSGTTRGGIVWEGQGEAGQRTGRASRKKGS